MNKGAMFSLVFLLIGTIVQGQDSTSTQSCAPKDKALEGQTIWMVSERMPQFPGGKEALDKFIASHLDYSKIETRPTKPIFVGFVVDTTGQVVNMCILYSPTKNLTTQQEVLRVMQLMPKWIPGQQGRRKVAVRYSHPVKL